jgi:hypothetical protein
MMVDIVTPVVITATTVSHTTMSFARPYDLKMATIRDRLEAVKPTLFLGALFCLFGIVYQGCRCLLHMFGTRGPVWTR